jgi:hypothetical protein
MNLNRRFAGDPQPAGESEGKLHFERIIATPNRSFLEAGSQSTPCCAQEPSLLNHG